MAALNFPSSPANGDVYQGYVYNAPDGSDALLAKYQLGEDGITLDMVKARKDEINALHPYPTPPES